MIDTFKTELAALNTMNASLPDYLRASLESDKSGYCVGWAYLKANITPELRGILADSAYWTLDYNRDKEDFILKRLPGKLSEAEKKQLGSFVFIYNSKRRDAAKEDGRQAILSRGYEEITGEQKELSGLKVKGIFTVSKLSILGSFDAHEELEGKLFWSVRDAKGNGCLMLMPKRSRSRGYLIREKAYIKRCEV